MTDVNGAAAELAFGAVKIRLIIQNNRPASQFGIYIADIAVFPGTDIAMFNVAYMFTVELHFFYGHFSTFRRFNVFGNIYGAVFCISFKKKIYFHLAVGGRLNFKQRRKIGKGFA